MNTTNILNVWILYTNYSFVKLTAQGEQYNTGAPFILLHFSVCFELHQNTKHQNSYPFLWCRLTSMRFLLWFMKNFQRLHEVACTVRALFGPVDMNGAVSKMRKNAYFWTHFCTFFCLVCQAIYMH